MPRADYAPSSHAQPRGAVIGSVDPGSPADRAGLARGDVLTAVEGHRPSDILDWQWLTDGTEIGIEYRAADGTDRSVGLTRDPDQAWGINFADRLFDGVRTCRNDCLFCFVLQLPGGMRPALYVRDDDFRLSFLDGNFITLTNLDDADVARIAEQGLSPLHVSVHATEPEIRRRLICPRGPDIALERFDEILDAGIDVHVQIVLVPGVNDGAHLDETLRWLAEREGVLSVGVVPLGFTGQSERFSAGYGDAAKALEVISTVQKWQFSMREAYSKTWVYLADEFYLNARAPFPNTEWYDDFPQFQNGIGMVRAFADEAAVLRERLISAVCDLPETDSVTVVTSMMAATTIAGALGACEAAGRVRVLVVPNRFFGGSVSVTGLLTGNDLSEAIERDANRGIYLIPDIVMNADQVTLDDMTLRDLVDRTGRNLRLVSSDAAGLLDGLERAAGFLADTREE